MRIQTAAEWITEQVCHATAKNFEASAEASESHIVEVVVPAAAIAEIIAEAEVICAASAVVAALVAEAATA